MTPRLSIVVPFYNVERYIGDCLDSVARQTFTDFEVILVDDGSRDGSARIANRYAADDKRFRVVVQENQGLGPARNTGVQHAQSEYITFLDSDDLVPRHAYEIMVRSLDDTSSSLAGGNARRFNNTAGVRQSYVHRLGYAKNRPATHVFDVPELAIDRMVWNKVYRRRFWDQFKYEFPAIRYEDYPVTLRAHVDAITVDCIAAPVYYWRERESGESITQLKFQYANLEDRVVSAEMVLDLLDQRAHELRPIVHSHLAEIDLSTLIQAVGTAPEEEVARVVALGDRLAARLDPKVLTGTGVGAFARLEIEALQAHDVELLQRLARFRADGGLKGGVRAKRHPALPWVYESQYPGLRDGSKLSASAYRLPRTDLEMRATAVTLEWKDDALVIHGTAEIAHLPTMSDSQIKVSLVSGLHTYRLPVERLREPDTHGENRPVGFVARVPRSRLTGMTRPAHLQVEMTNKGVRRRGPLTMGAVGYPVGDWVDGVWIQPVGQADGRISRLSLQPRRNAVELTAVTADGDDMVLTGKLPSALKKPVLRLARSAGDVEVPVERRAGQGGKDDFTVRIPLDDMIDRINPDDPFLQRTVLVPRVYDGDKQMLLLVTSLARGVLIPRGDRVVSTSRSPGQYLNLIDGPARVVVDQFDLTTDGLLTVSGPVWDGVAYDRIGWRHFLPNSDDAIEAPCRVTVAGRRWSGEIDLAELAATDRPNWILFAEGAGSSPYAILSDPFLLSRLPTRSHGFLLRHRSATLHLETD